MSMYENWHDKYLSGGTSTGGGYHCAGCGEWLYPGEVHYCSPYVRYSWNVCPPSPNPTEQAYKIMKKLLEKKVVPEPKSYKKFCELLEAIREVI